MAYAASRKKETVCGGAVWSAAESESRCDFLSGSPNAKILFVHIKSVVGVIKSVAGMGRILTHMP